MQRWNLKKYFTMTYLDDRNKRKLGLLPKMEFKKQKKPLKKVSDKKLLEMKVNTAVKNKEDLEKWFKDIEVKHFGINGGHCMECGLWIPPQYARAATAHLLPKKIFESVASHPLNYLILGAGCGCHDKTHRVDKFVQMKVWPLAASRIKQLIPLLPFDELRHISNQLDLALENT